MRFAPRIASALIPFVLAACADIAQTEDQGSLTAPQLTAAASKGDPRITITDLGVAGDARAINARGDVVGWYLVAPGVDHAFVWRKGNLTDLDPLGGHSTAHAEDINNRGQIVGSSSPGPISGPAARAVLWDDGEITDLGTLGGASSRATAINNRGQIIIQGPNADGEPRAGVWEDGAITELPLPRDIAFNTLGGDINNQGQVVGHRFDQFTNGASSVMWDDEETIVIGNFGNSHVSFANAVNERGQVVGESALTNPYFDVRPFFWDGGEMIDLGTLGGPFPPIYGAAKGINEPGQIVGWSMKPPMNNDVPVLWWHGELYELGTLAGGSGYASDINNRGQAVGRSWNGSETRAVMWTIR